MTILQHRIFGRKVGNFNPAQPEWKFLGHMNDVYWRHLSGSLLIYAPVATFTNRIASLSENCIKSESWLARPNEPADGFLVEGTKLAVAIFNADCPVLCLYQEDKLAVLHAGYRCLIRANPEEESIVEIGLKLFDSQKVHAFIFGGIGPCCWKPEEDKPEINNPDLCRYPEILRSCLGSTTTQSPVGCGHTSVDLYRLASKLLFRLGVPPGNIVYDDRCTCHAIDERGKPHFWSHTRFQSGQQGKIDGRNLTIAWLE